MPATYARPLIEGLRCEVVVRNDDATVLFPKIHPAGYEEAVRRALGELNPECFQEAVGAAIERPVQGDISRTLLTDRGMIIEVRQKTVQTTPDAAYRAFCSLGGKRGWLYMGWLRFEARPVTKELTRLVDVVFFAPRGVFGLLYWYTLYPVHRLIFAGLLRRLARVAERDGGLNDR